LYALLVALVSQSGHARDDGRYANSPLKPWFDSLKSGKGHAAPMPTATRLPTPIGKARAAITASGSKASGSTCLTMPSSPSPTGRPHHGLADQGLGRHDDPLLHAGSMT
jgi:hypothetical protein